MSYVALDRAIWTSTVLKEGPVVVSTLMLLLADADRFGETRATPTSIASVLRISDVEIKKAFQVLASPDPESRNQEHKGRRIIDQGNGTWLLTSFAKYKTLASKEAALERQRKYDQRKKGAEPVVTRSPDTPDGVINPLIKGRRAKIEAEVRDLITEIAELEDRDPVEVLQEAADYEGSKGKKVNYTTLGDDRLLNTWQDLKANLRSAKRKKRS